MNKKYQRYFLNLEKVIPILSHKKAQVIGQVFVFILAVLVFVLVVTYGYRAIKITLENQAILTLIQFKNDLENTAESIKARPGSAREFKLRTPTNTNEICFVDFENPESLEQNRPLIYSLWNSKRNIFLLPKPSISFYLPNFKVENGYCCINTKGNILLRFENIKNKLYFSSISEKCKK